MRQREQIDGGAEDVVEIANGDGAVVSVVWVALGGKELEGKGAGEPDEIFAPGDAGEVAGQLLHGLDREGDALIGLARVALADEVGVVIDQLR